MTAACRFCDNGIRYSATGQLRACPICNPRSNGDRLPDDPVPIGLKELYSRLRAIQDGLRVAEYQACGTRSQRRVAVENVQHALAAISRLLEDLELYGVIA